MGPGEGGGQADRYTSPSGGKESVVGGAGGGRAQGEEFKSTGPSSHTLSDYFFTFQKHFLSPEEPKKSAFAESKGLQKFSVKDQMVNILGFVGHTASVTTTHCALRGKQPSAIPK